MSPTPLPRRRLLLSGLALPLLAARGSGAATIAEPAGFPNGVTFLTSGPAHGYIAGWAKLLAPYLLQGLPADTASSHDDMGGPDGVTVANAFGERIAPDGSTLLFAPGAALLAWLRGDVRVKYDPGHWIAVIVGVTPGVLVGRASLPLTTRTLRLAATNPVGPELAAILGLGLLGYHSLSIAEPPTPQLLGAAIAAGDIDYALVTGPRLRESLAILAAQGVQPQLVLGEQQVDGSTARDPLLPQVPTLEEIVAARGLPSPVRGQLAAYTAASAAARTCFVAVLADLLRPTTLAHWRQGAALSADSLSVTTVTDPQDVKLLTGQPAMAHLGAVEAAAPLIPSISRMLQQRGIPKAA